MMAGFPAADHHSVCQAWQLPAGIYATASGNVCWATDSPAVSPDYIKLLLLQRLIHSTAQMIHTD